MRLRNDKMTEASLKRDRDDGKSDAAAVEIKAVDAEAIPQAAVEDEDMVGPMLPPQAKKRKVIICQGHRHNPQFAYFSVCMS